MKKINWFEQFINLLVVILGISIAFMLDNYRENNNRKNLELQYLTNLNEDLKYDLQLLDTLISLDSSMYTKMDEILTKVEQDKSAMVGAQALDLIYAIPFSAKSVTFETIKESGNLDVFSSYELQNSIVFLYDQIYGGNQRWDDLVQEHIDNFVKPLTLQSIIIKSENIDSYRLLRNQEYVNSLVVFRRVFDNRHNFRLLTREHVVQVQKVLEAQIERRQ